MQRAHGHSGCMSKLVLWTVNVNAVCWSLQKNRCRWTCSIPSLVIDLTKLCRIRSICFCSVVLYVYIHPDVFFSKLIGNHCSTILQVSHFGCLQIIYWIALIKPQDKDLNLSLSFVTPWHHKNNKNKYFLVYVHMYITFFVCTFVGLYEFMQTFTVHFFFFF